MEYTYSTLSLMTRLNGFLLYESNNLVDKILIANVNLIFVKKKKNMARTPSNMLALKTIAPDFILPDTITDKNVSLNEAAGEKGTLIMFICNHCPYVLHVKEEMVDIAKSYQADSLSLTSTTSPSP